ncbi:MAG TPA: rRNA maturation RNase YbeY [Gemmatimonadales bacterium]|nr:rRNA maturation RNase YbeY [Gemmatimonadales bacterium]
MASGTAMVSGAYGLPPRDVETIVSAVLAHDARDAAVSVTFLGLTAMARLHEAHKHRSGPTDVLSFSLPQPDGSMLGDIYVCPGVAAREARRRGITRREELVRLVVHGTLHVLGHDHPEGTGREASEMWRRQELLVESLG